MISRIKHINIEITRRCDQHCEYCFNNSSRSSLYPELNIDQWLSIIYNLAKNGLDSVHITGGEPFISKKTIPLLREAQRLGLSTSILSNGFDIPVVSLLEPQIFKDLKLAQLSLDSMDSTTHDKRRGKIGAWAQAMSAINTLRLLNVEIEISCTVDFKNKEHTFDIAEFCRKIGSPLVLRPIIRIGRAKNNNLAIHHTDYKHLERIYGDILKSDSFNYLPTEVNFDQDSLHKGFLTILPNGNFRRDILLSDGSSYYTNIRELPEAA